MALAVLSPWPDGGSALADATTCIRDALGVGTDDEAQRLAAAASALVERYAPGAPQALRNEAVIRCAGWLREAPSGPVRSEATGEIRTSFDRESARSALRGSGAMSLLTTWKVRRAGAI